jgi:hypothetical protein
LSRLKIRFIKGEVDRISHHICLGLGSLALFEQLVAFAKSNSIGQ